ncbi:hypothetical protein Ddye_026052 [Dipteronia dyeriana]|uniref:Uncharacterized protein n=1 Tax=Dipteronia dyeriana TaxID=168575 RepID=A0AAD9TLI1_9ROSI|nr:hypothetical protein Ddye_026052 [Dipteronia dyeriana]
MAEHEDRTKFGNVAEAENLQENVNVADTRNVTHNENVGVIEETSKNEDLDQYLLHLRNTWVYDITITVHCKLKLIHDIKEVLGSCGDGLKMALVLFANNILFGQDYQRQVEYWLMSLVEDIHAFNSFPREHYVFKMILHYL